MRLTRCFRVRLSQSCDEAQNRFVLLVAGVIALPLTAPLAQTSPQDRGSPPKSDSSTVKSLVWRANYRYSKGDLVGAERYLSRAIRQEPDSVQHRLARAWVRLEAGRCRSAGSDLEAIADRLPDERGARLSYWRAQGAVAAGLGDDTRHARCMRELLKLEPDLVEPKVRLLELESKGAEMERMLAAAARDKGADYYRVEGYFLGRLVG